MDKQIDYSQFTYDKELIVKYPSEKRPEREIELSVELNDFDGNPDCKIGHFGYNFYLRTNAGLKYKKYASRNKLEAAVWQCAIKNGLTPVKWIEKYEK